MSEIDDVLDQYGSAPQSWPGERQLVRDRGQRDIDQQMAWDRALGDPNLGYQVRLPGPLASARATVADKAKTVGDAMFGWMTPAQKEQLAFAANFAGPAAPLVKAAFMVPGQMARLQAAGRIQPGARGSQEALKAAEAEWAKGNLDTWKDFGWAHKSAFGPNGQEPIAWHDTRDFSLKPTLREAFERFDPDSGQNPASRPGMKVSEAFVGRGVDDMMIAEPSLHDVPVKVKMHNDYPLGGVAFGNKNGYLSGVEKVEAAARNVPTVMDVAVHEVMGHAVPMQGGALKVPMYQAAGGAPIPGTVAEAALQAMTDEARSRAIAARMVNESPDRVEALRHTANTLDERAYEAPKRAAYFAAPHELMAREAMMRHLNPLLDEVPPGMIDVYAPQAWPGGRREMSMHQEHGLNLRDYAPPNSPWAKKD